MATTKPATEINGRITKKDLLKASEKARAETITITPPRMAIVRVLIRGTTPLVQNRFGSRPMQMMKTAMESGSQAKKGRKREPKDFRACWQDARHISREGWDGINATGFRSALVDACRLCGFRMTHGKLGIFIIQDGYGAADSKPLVRITKGEPKYFEDAVRNQSGVADIRPRPLWEPGWEAVVTMKFDADMFSATEVINLLMRVGVQCGIGDGRPNSTDSCGQGRGLFDIVEVVD